MYLHFVYLNKNTKLSNTFNSNQQAQQVSWMLGGDFDTVLIHSPKKFICLLICSIHWSICGNHSFWRPQGVGERSRGGRGGDKISLAALESEQNFDCQDRRMIMSRWIQTRNNLPIFFQARKIMSLCMSP